MTNRLLTLSLLIAGTSACSNEVQTHSVVPRGTAQVDSTDSNSKSEPSIAAEKSSDAAIEAPESPASDEVAIIPFAATPVPVAGASLVCSFAPSSTHEAQCKSYAANGQIADLGFTHAQLIVGSDLIKTPTALKSLGIGAYSIDIPANVLTGFAIVLSDDQNNFLADWIAQPGIAMASKVIDGSFEQLVISPRTASNPNILVAERSNLTVWSVANAPGSVCSDPVIEVHQNSIDAVGSSEGTNWIELNSTCVAEQRDVNNIIVSQTVKLDAGNSYEVLFDYRRRADGAFNTLNFSFGEAKSISITSATTAWATYRTIYTATSSAAPLVFSGSGPANFGIGPQLDNIRIVDLGKL